MLFRFQKRSSYGLTMNFNMEYSQSLQTAQLNPGDAQVYQENASDFPFHAVIEGVYELPIGRGKLLFGHSNTFEQELIGGFTVNTIWQYLTGAYLLWSSSP